ncbi:MAG: DoxX family protein [Weeksellaceae bacterium]|jgi:uncharacterized membrane protein YphA (DoxX/SURF4 family)|nr:DoxX family protein [Weeksellaceae bacterium]
MEHLAEIFILLMLAIAFLQSGVDKAVDWKGNLEFMQQHFSKSPFKNMVKTNLFIVTVLELISGTLALVGAVLLFVNGQDGVAKLAAVLSAITLGCLFTGQRLSKDYPGAQTIVVYLIPVFFLLWLLFGG